MLILVGVSIQVVINSNLIGTAQDAADRTEAKYQEEGNMSEVTIGDKTFGNIEEYLTKIMCSHEYSEGICTICGTECVHNYESGTCRICGNKELDEIQFTIDGTTYTALRGMNWEKWCTTSYCNGSFYTSGGGVYKTDNNYTLAGTHSYEENTFTIIPEFAYYTWNADKDI